MIGRILFLSLVIWFLPATTISQPVATDTEEEARLNAFPVTGITITSEGHAYISLTNGRGIEPAPEPDQVTIRSALVAPDKATIGWLAEFPNCCTSYPVPTRLIVYKHGNIVNRFGDGRMITMWRFLSDGKEVAFCTDALHGPSTSSCERDEIETGRRIERWDSWSEKPLPAWAKENK